MSTLVYLQVPRWLHCCTGVVQTLATVFGLRHTYDTPVGDETIRGVSGGEKKRVSIAEMMATRICIGCWDK